MALGRREQAYAAFFALLNGSTYFRLTKRNAFFAFDQIEDFPAVVMVDGGEDSVAQSYAVLTTACRATVIICVRRQLTCDIGPAINEAREEVLTKVGAWQTSPLINSDLVTSVKLAGMSDPDFDPTNSQKAAAALEFVFDVQDAAHPTLSY